MNKDRTSVSKAATIHELGDFWGSHDLARFWDQTETIQMEFEPESAETYFRVEAGTSKRLRRLARQRGISPETLLNLWAKERLEQESTLKR